MTCGAVPGLFLDYSRQRVTSETMRLLHALGAAAGLPEKIACMARGERINTTEDRAVGHIALRAPRAGACEVDGVDVAPAVHAVLDAIAAFSRKVRDGEHLGATGKPLTDVVSIGIGGSYLGPEFVYEALRHDAAGKAAAAGRRLRFLANVDPVDLARALEGLDPETTLVIICSKTFTTAETMLNARTVKRVFEKAMGGRASAADVAAQHIVACSANVAGAQAFGIKAENVFGFWDWVGGRYSVCSAIGVLPLSLQYGAPVVRAFLDGAAAMDAHFTSAPMEQNLPVIMGLTSVWNSTFLGYSSRALLPYSQALLRFPAHIQQVDMESNGKRVALDGTPIPFAAGEINFGEPGTNGQHSFYQLIHQGRVIPCDLIGVVESQHPVSGRGAAAGGEPVSNHEELMANFFAQADALAVGKSVDDLKAEGVPERLWAHKEFPGNRPSLSLLLDRLDAFAIGQLLALYEHRTAVQGFVWGVNSFDQWGVELGKALGKKVRNQLAKDAPLGEGLETFNASTQALLTRFVSQQQRQ